MFNHTCEDTSSCRNFQFAICLHCNRRLCLRHVNEHNQAVLVSMQALSDEVESTYRTINEDYEKSRDAYKNLLASLEKWRTQQADKIEQVYNTHLQSLTSKQDSLNIMQQELTRLLDQNARQPLGLMRSQQSANVEILQHISQIVKRVQQHGTQLKWNFKASSPATVVLPAPIVNQQPILTNYSALIPKRTNSWATKTSNDINLRRFRAFKRLVEMFNNLIAIEQSKEDIADYLAKQGPRFQLPILVCSYLTAWHRKLDNNEKVILLSEHISTINKYLSHDESNYSALQGIHAFFLNERIPENKRDMMSFVLQYFVEHHCVSRNQILKWYHNKDVSSYQGFDGVKQMTSTYIKSLCLNHPVVQASNNESIIISVIEEDNDPKIKIEPVDIS